MKLTLAVLLFGCGIGHAATTVAGTLCSGTRATVTMRQLNAQGSAVNPSIPPAIPTTYTAGAFSRALNDGADGSYYTVRVQCPALQPVTDTTYRWMIPQTLHTVTPAEVGVATDGSVAIAKGYYWDDTDLAWKTLAAGLKASASGTGTVTSVAASVPSEFSVAGSPVTTSGTLAVTKATQTANKVWASATSGGAAQPAFRALVSADQPAATLVRPCEIVVGDPGAASSVLANDSDTPGVCANDTGATMTITAVHCFSDAGSPTVTPIITGGSGTSILSGALTCSQTQGGAAGTLNGTPTQTNGQTIDGNITTAGGTAKYLVIRISRTL